MLKVFVEYYIGNNQFEYQIDFSNLSFAKCNGMWETNRFAGK